MKDKVYTMILSSFVNSPRSVSVDPFSLYLMVRTGRWWKYRMKYSKQKRAKRKMTPMRWGVSVRDGHRKVKGRLTRLEDNTAQHDIGAL